MTNLSELSLAQLTQVHNLLADKAVKRFPSKASALAKIETYTNGSETDVEVGEDGMVVDVTVDSSEDVDPVEDAEEDGVVVSVPALEGSGDEDGNVPFVKATKEELAAMDGPTRAAYRKARRAAARTLRKARSA
jgi:hypothetical protein